MFDILNIFFIIIAIIQGKNMSKSIDNINFNKFTKNNLSLEQNQILEFLKNKYGIEFSNMYLLTIYSYLCKDLPARSMVFAHSVSEIINYMARQYKADSKNDEVNNLKTLIIDFKKFLPSSELDDLSKKIHKLKQDKLTKYRHFNGYIYKQSDFDNIFITINKFLLFLMKNDTILDKIGAVEHMLQQDSLTKDDIIILKNIDKNLLNYFFSKCNNPNFFKILLENNLLSFNYNDEKIYWCAFPYIEKNAAIKSKHIINLLTPILNKIYNNEKVEENLIYLIVFKIGLKLKNKEFKNTCKFFSQWLKNNNQINFYFFKELEQLIKRLREIEEINIAYSILTELLKLHIDVEEKAGFTRLMGNNYNEASKLGMTDNYSYEKISEIVLKYFPKSVDLFKLLCDLHINAFNSLSDDQKKEYQRATYFKRAAIEYNAQDEYHHDIFYYYISCIRDIAENIFKENNSENIDKVIEILKKDNIVFFNRILLYLLYVSNNISNDILKEAIFNYDYLANLNYYHEYFLLINKKYNSLKSEDKKEFLYIIAKGLNEEWCKKNNYNFSNELSVYWIKRKFLPIKQYLSEEEKNKYKEYIKNIDLTDEDKFVFYMHHSVILGYSSPLAKGKLSEMKIDELIIYLNDFKSTEIDYNGPSYIGLAEDLSSDVKNNYKKYADNIEKFKRITNPVYIYYLLTAFRDSNLELPDWENIINFGCWIFEQKDLKTEAITSPLNRNITWKETKIAFIDLLNKFFAKFDRKTSISKEFLDKAFNMLSDLSLYNDDRLNEHNYDEHNYDYLTYAINSSFGRTFETLIFYIYWRNDSSDKVKKLLETIYAKFDYLEKYAILGQYVTLLNNVMPDWVEKHFKEIFPLDNLGIFKASFFTVLNYSNLTVDSFKLLKSEYEYVVHNNLFTEYTNIMERLSRHICNYYIHGDILINDSIINDMLNIYNNKLLRQNFIRLVGVIVKNNKTITSNDLDNLILLWKKYKEIIKDKESDYLDELKYFYFWYSSKKFISNWILDEIYELLDKYNVKFDNWIIWDRLIDDLPTYPDKVLHIVKKLSENDNFLSISKDVVIKTVKYITENSLKTELKTEKNSLINYILSKENLFDSNFWVENLKPYYK